jgi:hypothetical protein
MFNVNKPGGKLDMSLGEMGLADLRMRVVNPGGNFAARLKCVTFGSFKHVRLGGRALIDSKLIFR